MSLPISSSELREARREESAVKTRQTATHPHQTAPKARKLGDLERETGLGPATFSLEGRGA